MSYKTAQKVWNRIKESSELYTVSQLFKVQQDFEKTSFSLKYEYGTIICAICILLIGFGCSSIPLFSQIQQINILQVSILIASICSGCYIVLLCIRQYKLYKIQTAITDLKKIIVQRRKQNHQNCMILRASIDAWTRHLLKNDVSKSQITKFQNYVTENIKIEFIKDVENLLQLDCMYLRLAAQYADIPITKFIPRRHITLEHRGNRATA